MKTSWLLGLLGVVVVILIAGLVGVRREAPAESPPLEQLGDELSFRPTTTAPLLGSSPAGNVAVVFETPKKIAHFESSTPAHGAVLPSPPVNVVVNVNFDLSSKSSMFVTSGGKEYGTGPTTVDANKLSMRRTVDPSAPDGLYTVAMTACWPDGSCHDGTFQFAVDRQKASGFVDLRGQKEVSVDLAQIAFSPADIRISRGTRLTWKNTDNIEHYVNTDSHPAHTYYPAQNSLILAKDDTYTLVFDRPGAYPYHCSAHADTMVGTVLVE